MAVSDQKPRRRIAIVAVVALAMIALVIAPLWPEIRFLYSPETWLHGVWEVDYAASSETSLTSGLWSSYDFEPTGRLNASDGVCAGPHAFYVVAGREVQLHEYDPLSDQIPLPPQDPRPSGLRLGIPMTTYSVAFVDDSTARLTESESGNRVLMRRVVGASHFYASTDSE